MKKTVLFKAETGGYILHHIPGVVTTPDGGLLAYCEARRSLEWGDWALARVIETEGSGYSDLCADRDGRLFCLYGAGGPRYPERGAGDIVPAEFDMDWLRAV